MSDKRTLIIAEAGVNHNGDYDTAKELIEVSAWAGADYVKFQTFKTDSLVTEHSPVASYQRRNDLKTQAKLLSKLELSLDWHKPLMDHAEKCGVKFMSTAFDLDSIAFLNELNLSPFKIPSGEITNLLYLRAIGSLKKKIIMSTGMATLGEVESALKVLENVGTPLKDVTLLHCTSEYPTRSEDVNLRAMITLRDCFDVDVGYSDHTIGFSVPVAAVTLGAAVIEKHFTLDRALPGPDHQASLEPQELKQMVQAIREAESCLGSSVKKPTRGEIANADIARRSIVAKKQIKKGEVFSVENITVKRPGTGISPMQFDSIVGRRSIKNFDRDDLIEI